jgi:hypothetical protein
MMPPLDDDEGRGDRHEKDTSVPQGALPFDPD